MRPSPSRWLAGRLSVAEIIYLVILGGCLPLSAFSVGPFDAPPTPTERCPLLGEMLVDLRAATQLTSRNRGIPETRDQQREAAEADGSDRSGDSGASAGSVAGGSRRTSVRGRIPPTLDLSDYNRWLSAVSWLPEQRVVLPGLSTTIRIRDLREVDQIAPTESHQSPGDVYYTAWGVAAIESPRVRVRFPETIRVQFNESVFEPSAHPPAFRASRLSDLAGGTEDSGNWTRIAEGMQSEVFWVHPSVPNDILGQARAMASQDAEAARYWVQDWIRFHATQVIKATRFELFTAPSGSEVDGHRRAHEAESARRARLLRRDVIGTQLAAALFSDVLDEQGHRILEVAPILSSPEQLAGGVLVQSPVHGFSLFEIQQAMDRLNPTTASHPRVAEMSERRAQRILELSGIRTQEDRRRMRTRIIAIEEAYRQVHRPAIALQRQTGTAADLHNSARGGFPGPVGLDYNHGSNVIWDGLRQIGVVVDR